MHERSSRATVWTKYGMVKVVWHDVVGDRGCFSSGTGDAKREAVPAIEHIEKMCEALMAFGAEKPARWWRAFF